MKSKTKQDGDENIKRKMVKDVMSCKEKPNIDVADYMRS